MRSRLQSDTDPASDGESAGSAEVIYAPKGAPLAPLDSAIFKDVDVVLAVRLGELMLTVHDLLALKAGSVVKLDAKLNDLVELRLSDSVVARGEIVAVGDNFGIRIVDIAGST